MKKTINNVLLKSYVKKKDFFIYIITVSLMSLILINILNTTLYIGGDYLKKIARKNYGDFHYIVTDLEKETANEIKSDNLCYKAGISQAGMTDEQYIVSCDENYMEISGIKMLKGEFPQKDSEALCSVNYLYQMGYAYEEMIGAEIEVDEKKYTITGLVTMQSLNDMEYSGGLIVFNINYVELPYNYDVTIESYSDNYKADKNKIIKKYDLLARQCVDNGNVLYISNRNEENKPTGFLKLGYIIMCIIIISLLVLVSSVFTLALGRTEKINNMYKKMGIKKSGIEMAISKCIFLAYFLGFVISNILIVAIIKVLNINDIKNYYSESIALQLIFIFINLVINIFTMRKLVGRDINKVKNNKIYEVKRKNVLKPKENLYVQMAKNVRIFGVAKRILIIVPLVISGIILVVALFYIKITEENLMNLNNYEYKITYCGNSVDREEIDEYMDTVNRLEEIIKKSDDAEIVPIYARERQKVYIEKSILSRQYKDILSNDDVDFQKQMTEVMNEFCTIKMYVIGTDAEYCETLGISKDDINSLKDDECIIIDNVNSYGIGSVSSGIKKGDKIKIEFKEDDKLQNETISVAKVYKNLKISLDNDNNEIKIVVPLDIFLYRYDEMISYSYPNTIYINCAGNEEVLNVIKGCRYVNLINIKEENAQIEMMNNIIMCMADIIIGIVIVLTIINTIFVIGNRFHEIKKVSNILKIIGVRSRNIMKVFLIDIKRIFVISYIIVVLVSTFVCYAILEVDMSLTVYLRYYYPVKIMVLLAVIYGIMFGILFFIFSRKILYGNTMSEMKEENE